MWRIYETDQYKRRYKRFAKKQPGPLKQMLRNLSKFTAHLESGRPLRPLAYGFLHVEPMGVVAIDQSGGPKMAETRLYAWVDVDAESIYLLTLGDKRTQPQDVQDCKRFVRKIPTRPVADDPEGDGDEDEGDREDEVRSDG